MIPILYIDNHPDACHLFQTVAQTLSLPLEIATTINQAKEQIERQTYEGYIIVEFHPETLTLIEMIKSRCPTCLAAFISQPKETSATTYESLKDNLHADYVLELPIKPEEAETLLKNLAHLAEPVKLSQIAEKIPLHLKEAYNKSIYEKLQRLDNLVEQIIREPTLEHISALKQDVHKIAGSAASYGYQKTSDLCRLWENRLATQIDPLHPLSNDPQDYLYNRQFLRAIKLYFQHLYPLYTEDFLLGTPSPHTDTYNQRKRALRI